MVTKRTRIKICCIMTAEEAQLAVESGASALGLVSEMPSGPGVISEEQIRDIVKTVPPGVSTFLLTSRQDPYEIIRQQKKCGVNTIQICDFISMDAYGILRKEMPGISIVQVIHVYDGMSVEKIGELRGNVDAILLDSGNQFKQIKELGGTGRTHDWRISRTIRENSGIPLFLAGGLNPENVVNAIEMVRPFGVDICSGVRTAGKLDASKLSGFINKVTSTFLP